MRRDLRLAAVLLVVAIPWIVAAGGKAAPNGPAAKGKASASVSASVTASASVPLIPPAPLSSSSVVAPVGSVATSPLTPRIDETPPVKASASGKPAASYDALMAEVAALRARVAVISNAVWKSRITVSLRVVGSHARIASAKLFVDNALVWTAPKGFSAEDMVSIFDGGVAPGLHAVALEIERRDDRDETFRTIDRTTATLMVPQGKKLEVETRLDDDSDMGGDFTDDGDGKYDLRLRMKAQAVDAK
jgi:hypothetical protein